MKCAGCSREIAVGDHYIADSPSGFMAASGNTGDPALDDIIALLLGGDGTKIVYCEDCTEPGGDYLFETFYGDESGAVERTQE